MPKAGTTAYDSTTDELVDEDPRRFRLKRGETVHRYVVLYELGVGGMGVVYAAYDPELDRKVALKLLHPHASSRGRARLLREAKAIASLSHPNVVTVHDVGTYEGHVFVAMEFVDGVTFRRWMQAKPRTWREVAQVLGAAGRGLAAAHAADLVHRDFKPDNILVEHGGRVVVLDFGLARRASTHDDDADLLVEHGRSSSGHPDSAVHELDVELTRTGARLGTPAYMAPEQHLSAPTDARTDQFAFCVVMWEAIHGARPFRGETPAIMAARVLRGELEEPPREADVPSRIRKVLVRGLSVEPKGRYRDMRSLLEDLARDPVRQHGRWLVAALFVLGGGGAAAAYLGLLGGSSPCRGAEDRFETVWNDDDRERVRTAFLGTGVSYAKTAWTGVESKLDAYQRSWALMYRDACEATHVRHEQSTDMLDLRMACLRGRRAEVASLVEEFTHADGAVVRNAVEAVSALGRLDRCEDLEALAARVRPPEEEHIRERVDELRNQLSDAKAKEFAGRYDAALDTASRVAGEAERLGYAPLLAEAKLRRASVLERTGDFAGAERMLLEAIWAAESSRHEEIAARAWVKLVWVSGVERIQPEQGHLWGAFARSSLDRLGHAKLLEVTLTHNLGGVAYREGRLEEALDHYRQALRAQQALLGSDDPAVAMTFNHIGNTLIELERYPMARDYCERSLELRQRVLGERHPKVAASLNNLGELLRKQGQPEQSLGYARQALSIVAGTGGPEERVALALEVYALGELERWDALARSYARLLEIETERHGHDDPRVVTTVRKLGLTQLRRGDADASIELLERAAEADRAAGRRNDLARSLAGLARAHLVLGAQPRAQELYEDARKEARRADPSDPELLEELREPLRAPGEDAAASDPSSGLARQ